MLIAAQVGLSALVAIRNTRKIYPAFAFFIYFAASKSLVLLGVAVSMSGYAYFYTYVVMSFASNVAMCFSVRELYRLTFGPRLALPQFASRHIAIAVPAAIASCVALSMVVSAVGVGWMTQALDRGEKMITLSLCVVLVWMAAYARFVGVSWGKRSAEIASGFVLFLAVNSLTIFSRGTKADSRAAEIFGMGAYLCALVWWGMCLLKEKEQVPKRLTVVEVEAWRERLHGAMPGVCVPIGAKEDGNTELEGRP